MGPWVGPVQQGPQPGKAGLWGTVTLSVCGLDVAGVESFRTDVGSWGRTGEAWDAGQKQQHLLVPSASWQHLAMRSSQS